MLLALAAAAYWLRERSRGQGFDWQAFGLFFVRLDFRWVAVGAGLCLLTYVVRALRWAVLLRPVAAHPSFLGLVSATAVGFAALVILGRPGEFVRPYLISVRERVSFSSQLAAWLLERIYDLLAALCIFGFSLSQVRASGIPLGPQLAWVVETGGYAVGILCAICLVLLVFMGRFGDIMRRRILGALEVLPDRLRLPANRSTIAFLDGAAATGSWGAVFLLVLYTALEWTLIAAGYYSLMRSSPAGLGFGVVDILIFMGFVSFGAVVQIPGVGGGTQLVAIVVLTQVFSVPAEAAASLAVLIWVSTFVIVVPFGILLGLYEGWNWSQIRQAPREVK